MSHIRNMDDKERQYSSLLAAFIHIEEVDNRFIKDTMTAGAQKKVQEMEIATLLLVNRLFTQSCRMQIYGMKDLRLSQEQINKYPGAQRLFHNPFMPRPAQITKESPCNQGDPVFHIVSALTRHPSSIVRWRSTAPSPSIER